MNDNGAPALSRLAREATEAGNWVAAHDAWTACLALAADPPEAWRLGLLRANAALGDIPTTRAQTTALLAHRPASMAARNILLRLLVDRHDHAALAVEVVAGSLADSPLAEGLLPHFRALCVLGDLRASRVAFDRLLPMLREPSRLQILFDRAPGCFGPVRLRERWEAIAARLAATADEGAKDGDVRRTLTLRLDVARGDYAAFQARWMRESNVLPGWRKRFGSLARRLSNSGFPDRQQRKVFGIGMSKTGTTSLAEALATLGYDTAHFRNPFTNVVLGEADFDLFDAATDSPVASRFETLYERYPNAVFIMTEREPLSWQDSVMRHRLRARGSTASRDMAALAAADGPDSPLQPHLPIDPSLWGDDLIGTHDAFRRRVADFFAARPGAKLLRLNLFEGHGWREICAFLGHADPAAPFPHGNLRHDALDGF